LALNGAAVLFLEAVSAQGRSPLGQAYRGGHLLSDVNLEGALKHAGIAERLIDLLQLMECLLQLVLLVSLLKFAACTCMPSCSTQI
jgi:hypothetical protein